ncbi:adenine phosphoribosyltransferase APT2 KNAG_0C03060 [Huiozyma naganishii CBS 8797]|uniref:adenine phosphoribosyltransferase n=1 Tax=Huiozyma naganishii (strain ATCC MYA-139 / BCRC 22969 / CBS 8797 / KCTC 17520 / NBRC 10181 / NCYC 3082 / Yp74L-3) TaxID=1071383 RepID=J7RWM6_HUIN7|nr:hypothetical protein KNAG_0C03060 [Kazachstania naganishii CBS 8797]CCK69417.1 hypothetical protein KNAG_0C03060 [Kazachstania naganishii CBS 8797]
MPTQVDFSKELRPLISKYRDFPEKGRVYYDISPILKSPDIFRAMLERFRDHLEETFTLEQIDFVASVEASGFLFGPTLATFIGVGFIPIRKVGMLPGICAHGSTLDAYGQAIQEFEIQSEAIPRGSNVVIVDNILLSGNVSLMAKQLVTSVGGNVVEYDYIMEQRSNHGRRNLNIPVFSLLDID